MMAASRERPSRSRLSGTPRTVEGRRPAGYYGVMNTRDVRGAVAANPFIELWPEH